MQRWPLFIRCTKTSSRVSGEGYFTYRLVEAVREGTAVKQRTLLNLGAHFDVAKQDWADLAARIDELLRGQGDLIGTSPAIEAAAQRYAAQIVARRGQDTPSAPATADERFQEVDLSTLELVRPRSVGVEHAALSALGDLGVPEKLAELGFNRPQIAAALGNIAKII